jgi:hypothetical protein
VLIGPDKQRCLHQGGTIQAQAETNAGTGIRGSIPPGASQDGSRPSEGAIKGGAILPGESAGVPDATSTRPSEREINRCKQLTGVLRDECLRDLGASAGGTRAPERAPPPPIGRDPVTPPLPQSAH